MKQEDRRHEYNEVVIFLINLFVIEVAGKFLLTMILFLCRILGWNAVADAYHSIPMYGFWTFVTLMAVAVITSVIRILRK